MSGSLTSEQGGSSSGSGQEEDALREGIQSGSTNRRSSPVGERSSKNIEEPGPQSDTLYQQGAASTTGQSANAIDGRVEPSTNKSAPLSRTPSPRMAPSDKTRSPPGDPKPSLSKRATSHPPRSGGPPSDGHATPPLGRNAGYQQEQPPRGAYPPEQFGGVQQGPLRGPAGPVQQGGMGHGWLTKDHQQLPHQDMSRGWPQAGGHGYYEQSQYSPPGPENEVHYGNPGGYQGLRQPMPMYEDHGMHGNYQYATESQGLPFNKQHMQPIAPNRMHMHAGMYGQPKGHRGRSYNPGVAHPEYHMDPVDPHMARAHQDLLAQQQQQQQQMRGHTPQNMQRNQYRGPRDGSHQIEKQFDGMRLDSGGGKVNAPLDVHAPEYGGKKYSPPNQEFLSFSPQNEEFSGSPRAFSPSAPGSRVAAENNAKARDSSRSVLGCIGDGRRGSSGTESEGGEMQPPAAQKGGLASALSKPGGEEKGGAGGEGYEKPGKMSWASVMANGMAKDEEKKSDSEDGEPNLEDKNWVEKMISKQQRENEQLQAAAIKLAQTVVNYEMRQGKAAGADKPSVEMELQGLNGTHFAKGAPICVHFLQHGQCTWKSRSCPNSDTHHCGRCGGPHGTKAHSYLLKVLDQMR